MVKRKVYGLKTTPHLVLILSGLAMVACSPGMNMSLQRAQADYQQAANDASIKADASSDLYAAEKLLQQAETVWRNDSDDEETDHLAYLASRKVDLARATASQAESERLFNELSAKKNQIRLSARDAELARRNAEIAQLKAKKVPEGILVTLGDVLFDTARASLKAGSLSKMYPVIQYLKEHADTQVKIEGHTDSQGSSEYNAQLSRMRAESVKDFLVSNGISQDRITAQGMGEDYPIATNDTAAGRQQNRRVEMTITDSPGSVS